MRNLITILLVFATFFTFGQVQKGDMILGSNFGLIKQNADEDLLNYSYTTFILNYQYYITDNISLGIGPSVSSTKVLNDAFVVNTTGWNFTADYAFLSSSGKVMPYFGVKYSLFNTLVKQGDNLGGAGGGLGDLFGLQIPGGGGSTSFEFETKYKRKVLSGTAGVKFFITERINIDNNFTFGTILNEEIEISIPGLFSGSFESDEGGNLFQFTVGFGYIIARKGT